MKMKILAAAISAIGAVGAAQAAVEGQGILNVSNVLFYNNATNTVLSVTDFAPSLNIIDQANLNPCVGVTCNPDTPFAIGGNPLPLNIKTVGVGPGGDPFVPAPTPPTSDFAKAAIQLVNNPITGLPGNPSNGGTDAQASSLAQKVNFGTANTAASLTLASIFQFVLNDPTAVRFEFDAYKYLLAFTDAPFNAFSSVGWNISITDTSDPQNPVEIFDWSPNGADGGITGGTEISDPCSLNDSATAFYPASIEPGETCLTERGGVLTPHFIATTDALAAGVTYNLSISHETGANVLSVVPEPSSVLLAGLALAGLGFGARRKARSAN